MTKKDFIFIAHTLSKARPTHFPDCDPWIKKTWLSVVGRFGIELAKENDAFDRERFLQACGLSEKEIT